MTAELPKGEGCRDCGRFLLEVSGTFARSDVKVIHTSQSRPSNAEVDALIEQVWAERLDQAARTGVTLYDGALCRLIGYECRGRQLELTVGPVSFREFVGTNCASPHLRYKHGPEVLANPLGVSAALVTADGFVIMGRRSQRVAIHGGMIHPIGGMVELAGQAAPDPFATMLEEVTEEVAMPAGQADNIACLGLVRDKGLFQPELIFRVATKAESPVVLRQAREAVDAAEHSELLTVADEPSSIVNFIQRHRRQTTPVTLATLMLHGLNCWGSGWFATARGYLRNVV